MSVEPYTILEHRMPHYIDADGYEHAGFIFYSVAFMGEEVVEGPAKLASGWIVDLEKAVELLNHGFNMGYSQF